MSGLDQTQLLRIEQSGKVDEVVYIFQNTVLIQDQFPQGSICLYLFLYGSIFFMFRVNPTPKWAFVIYVAEDV